MHICIYVSMYLCIYVHILKETGGASGEVLARAVRGALGLVGPRPARVLAPSRVEAWRAFNRRGWQGGSFLIRTVW